MPELPEVETIARELNGHVTGRRIEAIDIFRADALGRQAPADFCRALRGREIRHCSRRGKYLIFHLHPERYLVVHLRMTGKFAVTAPLEAPLRDHRLWFHLDDGRVLVFQDLRCFGTLDVVARLSDSPALSKLGMEPLSPQCTQSWLRRALAASRTPLKPWLMDQTKIAGLGNIYASEILYAAGLDPTQPANGLDGPSVARLHRATRRILRKAILKSGTTISDFRRVDQKTGEFQHFLRVYGKAGEPCPKCKTPIAAIRQQQRSTFFCPRCQR